MILAFLLFMATQIGAPTDPLATLRDAYEKRDAEMAASAYSDDAEVIYRYRDVPEERYRGKSAIKNSFSQLFNTIDPSKPLDLNFRITTRQGSRMEGIYRLRVGRDGGTYGRFSALIAPDGRLSLDETTDAGLQDFEEAEGPVHLANDLEDLDRKYYAAMAGRYRLSDGCLLIVTRSITRLFVRNSCTQKWRGLTRMSGRHWSAGNSVIDKAAVTQYRFAPFLDGLSPHVTVTDSNGRSAMAVRADISQTEDVVFQGDDGVRLTGTLYLPLKSREDMAATVMVHGSGPQDRDGYASIIAVMADAMAAEGRAVLVYDKRGSGQSGGDGDRAGFDLLAADARAAMQLLRKRSDIDPSKVGLAGSSQAGWVIARAIELGALPHDVFLLGAAGAAISVREQNLFNTDESMRCLGLPEANRRLALAQQSAFFDFLANPKKAAALDSLTLQANRTPQLADWLFPSSAQIKRDDGSWYNILSTDYDPLPVWRKYSGRTLFLFGSTDDATPSERVASLLKNTEITTRVLPSAQHLGLVAASKCKAGLPDVDQFHPGLFTALTDFARHY